MASTVAYDDVEVGTELPEQTYGIRRHSLIRYCGASGDSNVIHWNERIAKAVGLPDVIAHGMVTMAEAGRLVTDWAGDPGAIVEYGVRFSRPVPVPDDENGALLTVRGRVVDKRADNLVLVELAATIGDGTEVLQSATALIRLS